MKMSSKQGPATVNRPNQKYLISLIAFVVFDIAVTMHKIVIEKRTHSLSAQLTLVPVATVDTLI